MRKLLFALCLVSLAFGVSSCKQKNQEAKDGEEAEVVTTRLTPDEFEKVIQDTVGVVLLDVRTDEEFEDGHMEGAVHINFRADAFLDDCLKQLPRDKKIAIYCRSGFCSHSAAKLLKENGFDVVDMIGGYTDWVKKQGKQKQEPEKQACKL